MKPLSSKQINNLKSDKGLADLQVPTSTNIEDDPLAYSGINKESIARTPKSIDTDVYNEYLDYGVRLNINSNLEDANRQKAKNQGLIEQVGRGIGQVVANEIVLGSLKGFSDIFDSVYNVIANEGYNDYTNPISAALEDAQNNIRERLAIYEEDPNASFNFTDSGWWINGLTTIASTLSLAIPARGITGAASALGKLSKANKALRYATRGKYGIGAAVAKLPKNNIFTNNPILNGAMLEKYGRLGMDALLMRTAENYQEARGVYQEVYDSAKERWENMDEEQRKSILERRPDWAGLNSDEIAQAIASESAGETFKNDMWLMALDAFQLKSLTNIYKGVGKTATSASLRAKNLAAVESLTADGAKQAGKKFGKLWTMKESLKHLDSPIYAELSEGFEEGWQGIQTERGKEYAEKVFNPQFVEKDIVSYISDPEIWEQAFWGYIGGIGFQSIGQGISSAKNKVVNAWQQHQAKRNNEVVPEKLTFEKLREEEIKGREVKFNELITDLAILENENRNPYKEKTADGVTTYKNQSSAIYGELDPVTDKETIKEMLINDFVTDLTMGAVEVGNEDLLIEYLQNPYLNKYIEETSAQNIGLDKAIVERIKDVKDKYYTELWKVANTVKGDNENVISLIARERARNKLRSEALRNASVNVSNEIDNLNTDNFDYSAQAEYDRVLNILDAYRHIRPNEENEAEDFDVNKEYRNNISNKERNFYINELRKNPYVAQKVAEEIALNGEDVNIEDVILKATNEYIRNKPETREALADLISRKNDLDLAAGLRDALLEQSDKDMQDDYNQIISTINSAAQKRITDAYDRIKNRVLENSNSSTILYDLANNNTSIFGDLQNDIETLNIGFSNGIVWQQMIAADLKAKKRNEERIAKTSEVNGENVAPEKIDIPEPAPESTNVEETATAATQPDASSTGEQTITDSAGNEVRQDVAPVEDELPTEATPEEENVIEELDSEYTAEYGEVPTIYTIRSLIVHNYKKYKNIYDDILKNGIDVNSDNYKFIREKVDNKIKDYNVDSDVYERVVDAAIAEALNFIAKNRNNVSFALTSSIESINDRKVIEDFIKDFVEKNNIPVNKNGKTFIDVNHIFSYLLDDPNYSYDDVRFIYMNINDYIVKSKDSRYNSPYSFINSRSAYIGYSKTKSLSAKLERAAEYLNTVINNKIVYNEEGSLITAPISNDLRNDDNKDDIVESLEDGETLTGEISGDQILFYSKRANVPITFLSKVDVLNNGSTLSDRKTTGLHYIITKNNDGSYTSNFDKIFEVIITHSNEGVTRKDGFNLYDLVYNYVANVSDKAPNPISINGVEDSIVVSDVLENSLVKELIDKDYIKFSARNSASSRNKATEVLRLLSEIVTNNKNAFTENDKRLSIQNWIAKVYDNYTETVDIQNSIENGSPIRISLENLDSGRPILSDKPTGIGSKKLHFNATLNPMVAITEGGTVQVEGSTTTYPANGLRVGTMGVLVRDGIRPVFALSEPNFNKINENSDIAKGLKEELVNIITDRLNGKSFDEFVRKVKDLFGGKGKGYNHNNLFTGFDIVYGPTKNGNNAIGLKIKGTDNYLFVAYRYRNGTTQSGTGITVYSNGRGTSFSNIAGNENAISTLADTIISNTRYNRTYLGFREFEKGAKPTYYITKDGKKLNIKLGSISLNYNSFGDFAIKNNIFNTYQSVDNNGNYFQRNSDRFYLKKENGRSPVEDSAQSVVVPAELFTSDNPNTPYDTKTVLKRLNVKEELVQNLIEHKLIPTQIYYRRSGPANARGSYNANTKRISVFNGFVSESNMNPRRAVTILMHEQFHKYFEESGYRKRTDITNELIDIYDEFVEALNKEPEKYKSILKWIEENNFTLDGYANNLPKKEREHLNENELRQLFAEEWLVESLSQQAILNAMNDIKSTRGDSNIEGENKSLFQKIIDAILKLFGINFDNVENNTILAREYKLLGDNVSTLSDTNDVDVINKEKAEQVDTTEETEESVSPDEDAIEVADKINEGLQDTYDDDFDMFEVNALTTEVDTDNTKGVNSIRSLIDTYDERERPGMARFVENGGINFRC